MISNKMFVEMTQTRHRRATCFAPFAMILRSHRKPKLAKFAIVKFSKSAPYSVKSASSFAVDTIVQIQVKMFVKVVIYFND